METQAERGPRRLAHREGGAARRGLGRWFLQWMRSLRKLGRLHKLPHSEHLDGDTGRTHTGRDTVVGENQSPHRFVSFVLLVEDWVYTPGMKSPVSEIGLEPGTCWDIWAGVKNMRGAV